MLPHLKPRAPGASATAKRGWRRGRRGESSRIFSATFVGSPRPNFPMAGWCIGTG